jgi:tetratricopeptide (TPR) repeat protein
VIETEAEKEFSRGLKALQEDNSLAALVCFEKANTLGDRPVYFSFLGFCAAKERGQVQKGILLCSAAIEREPENGVHYLNLGRIYLVAGNKQEAIRIFRKGLAYGPNQEIVWLLESIGTRKPPIIRSLSRDNLINKFLGKLLGKLGLR